MADRRSFVFGLFLCLAVLTGGQERALAEAHVVRVAAASDLRFALPGIARDFTRATGIEVRLSFGSSGNFTRQILSGAPFDMFLSADEAYITRLKEAGKTEGAGAFYAVGRLVLFVPHGSPLEAPGDWAGVVRNALAGARLRRFAIANPEHAPYGRAAAEALTAAGLWADIQPHLVMGENAAQAAQFAAQAADGGVIPLSIALSEPFRGRGQFMPIPTAQHAPLRQRMVILKGAAPGARLFYDHLQTPKARTALGHFGFTTTDND